MKKYLFLTLLLLNYLPIQSQTFNYPSAWRRVDFQESQGLPQSALLITDSIYRIAQQGKNYPQFIRALICKMKYRAFIENDVYVQNLMDAERIADSVTIPVKPILHSMLGEMYWWYYQNNRYKFYNRSKTTEMNSDDISTWDLDKIVSMSVRHYKKSLEGIDTLKKISINDFSEILNNCNEKNNLFRPTLYDFLIHRAIDFFMNDEAGLVRPINEFSMNNENYFSPAESFSQLTITTDDTTIFKYNALILLQNAIRFHLNDTTKVALTDADLIRLNFVYKNTSDPVKDSLYLKSLWLIKKNCSPKSEPEGEVSLLIAKMYFDIGCTYDPKISELHKWGKKKARVIINNIQNNENRQIINDSWVLLNNIDEKGLKVTIEKENIPDEPFRALVVYKNVDKIFVKIFKSDYHEIEEIRDSLNNRNYDLDEYIINILKKKVAVTKCLISLPSDTDYQEHSTEIKLPALDKGLYFIVTSTDSALDVNHSIINFGLTAITNLSYIMRNNGSTTDVYILNRKTGAPVSGVKAECWINTYNGVAKEWETKLYKTYLSDNLGYFNVNFENYSGNQFYLDFIYRDDTWSTNSGKLFDQEFSFSNYKNNYNNYIRNKTFFFTDRSIYRPGQTIYFKGIIIRTDGFKDNRILTNQNINVKLINVNWQDIAQLNLTSNEFGTFTGTFIAPNKGLNGLMRIKSDFGETEISVEDYKRPTFEVNFDTMHASTKPGEFIKIKGHSMAYTGSAIDNAKVSYRVERITQFPWRYNYWWINRPASQDKEIANGTIITNDKGEFEIGFKAVPDETVLPSLNPIFIYKVHADVTDINGETHCCDKEIRVGYRTLLIKTDIPDKLDKNAINIFKISTQNLEGNFVPSTGSIHIEKLKSPAKIFRDRKWQLPDKFSMSKNEFYKDFHYDIYRNENNPSTWPVETFVLNKYFNTGLNKKLILPDLENWEDGMYKLTMQSKDKFGEKITETFYFTLYNPKSKNLPYTMADWSELSKTSGEPGENIDIAIGSAFSNAHVLYELECDHKIVETKWLDLSNEQNILSIRLKEEYRGNIGVHWCFINNNRLYNHDQTIQVPYTNKMLDIGFETFRDKLQPGENEKWKIKIKGKNGDNVAAEMVATLYDASLDAIVPNKFDFSCYGYYYPYLQWNSTKCFDNLNLEHYTKLYTPQFNIFHKNYSSLSWFGFGYNSYRKVQNIKPVINYQSNNLISGHSSYKIISSNKQKGTEVSGKVIDASSGKGLNFVSVLVKGTTRGTYTDINGNFTIKIPDAKAILEFSFLGYEKETVKVNGKMKIEVDLNQASTQLGEVTIYRQAAGQKRAIQQQFESPVVANVVSGEIPDEVNNSEAIGRLPGISSTKNKNTQTNNIDLSNIKSRTNLNETAFFYPQLQTDQNGELLINFTIPEALTRWKMLGFAHTTDLKYGFIEKELETQKELMVTPNAPRFLREGDTMTFTAKINSLSANDLKGTAQLMLYDALTMKSIDVQMQNNLAQQTFEVKKGESVNLNWDIIIPSGLQAVDYKVVAKTKQFSDGEEAVLPVLTNSMLVTETMPLPVKGKQTKIFTLDKLLHNTSTTLRSHKLTLEYTPNPAWYAIQALPYLMEYPNECAEQTFSRFYANSLASLYR